MPRPSTRAPGSLASGGFMRDSINDDRTAPAAISWPRAIATTVIVAVVGIGLLAYGTDYLLKHLTGVDRSQRVAVGTTFFFVVLFALAFGLRRLQRRGIV